MRRTSWAAVVVSVAVAVVALPACGPPPPTRPFPQHVTYAGGGIRVSNRTQAQQDTDVKAFYDHWKANYLVKVGSDRYRVAMSGPDTPAAPEMRGVTTSESQGYGMLIVPLLAGYDANARTILDGLWRFALTNPSDIDDRLMGFRVPQLPDANNSAFDGDVDMAYGLLLAHKQWGSGGSINYLAEARRVLAGALQSTAGPQSRLPELGDWVDANGTKFNQWTPRPSDFMPAHFRAFARATNDTTWNTVANNVEAAVTSLQTNHAPTTGLLPDFTAPVSATNHTLRPAPASQPGGWLEGPNDDDYSYNSMRVPWRVGTDALVNNRAAAKTADTKISNWIRGKANANPANIVAGYELDGDALVDYFSIGFAAPFAVAAMTAGTSTANQNWLNALYGVVRATHEDYFEDSVALLSLLVITGNYWDPTV